MPFVTPEIVQLPSSLHPNDQAALRLLALLYAPVATSTFGRIMQQLGARSPDNRPMVPAETARLLERLVQQGVAEAVNGGFRCHPDLRHQLVRQAEASGELPGFAKAIKDAIATRESWGRAYYRTFELCVQDLRIAFYCRREAIVFELLDYCRQSFPRDFAQQHPYALICGNSPDLEWLQGLPERLLANLLETLLEISLIRLRPADGLFQLLETFISTRGESLPSLRYLYVTQLLLRGRIRDAGRLVAGMETSQGYALQGWLALVQGDPDRSVALFTEGIGKLKKETGKRKVCFADLTLVFYLVALIRSGLPHHLQAAAELGEWAVRQRFHPQQTIIWMLWLQAEVKLGINRYQQDLVHTCSTEYNLGPVSQLFHSLLAVWTPPSNTKLHLRLLDQIRAGAQQAGYRWIAAEAASLCRVMRPKGKDGEAEALQLFEEEGAVSLAGAVDDERNWERSLKALLTIGAPPVAKAAATKPARLVWLVAGDEHYVTIQPVEQKLGPKGWSAGRNSALKKLKEESARLDFLSPQDRQVIACIDKGRTGYGYYGREAYEFDMIRAVRALIGHPQVFSAIDLAEPVGVAKGEFTLDVVREKGMLRISLSPDITDERTAFFRWEGAGRLFLYEPTPEQRRIATILGKGLNIPADGESQVMAAITAVSPHVAVHSDVGGENAAAERVEADGRLHLTLRPAGAGLSLELRVRPLGDDGPGFYPGRGGATIIAELGGKKLQTSRDLAAEKGAVSLLLAECPLLEEIGGRDDLWHLDEPEECLNLLENLHGLAAAQAELLTIRWPEGERFRLKGSASSGSLRVAVHSGREWFSLEGEVAISDDEVVTLQRLLELTENSEGRFIPLGEGEFISLTDEFRRRLNDLRRMVDRHGKEQRFHPLSAPLVENALAGVGVLKGDKQWRAALERFRGAEALQPHLPVTLQASLRDYQREGFEWLCRLAHWGVGACLADDMGLGKTVQTLALLLMRAAGGPALVLAPTSVCLNWVSEASRFAPTLTPRLFGPGNRQEFVDSLHPFDLVICSYTLLQQEAELLTGVRWETVVLDEAQAIKNMATKRSQAAMQLQAGFRIATTGTPVENRLDELWNLFRFLNPGLLGSHKSFVTRFATPIEKNRDKQASSLLRKLIRPFILRRVKSQVLEELPPRTEIVQRVELSGEEAAFYEALRRNALEKLAGADDASPGERQIRILAEIMRLRRACCNPVLIMPETDIASAKLAAFREIVAELRDNGHRALVFSQFVDHLAILRRELESEGISYQYLDGATPAKERQQRVTAFQTGEGELFLISLKAGGVGLNLTAADYVIHMDPWWNPAVEDQASDRAHRIGQMRPVTVYRIVAANTIEEKIVALHHQKRDLADSLLEGTESASRVSAEDLLELLREAGG